MHSTTQFDCHSRHFRFNRIKLKKRNIMSVVQRESEDASHRKNNLKCSLALDSMEHFVAMNSHTHDRKKLNCICPTINTTIYQKDKLYNDIEKLAFRMNEKETDMEKVYEMVICTPDSQSDPIMNIWKARFMDPDQFYYKWSGIEKNRPKANELYQKAIDLNIEGMAQANNQYAQFHLGLMYANGQGVSRNETTAVYWFRRAAEQGHALGQNNLGVMYQNGQGVEKDDCAAAHWYRKAAEQGHTGGQYNLELMCGYVKKVQKDEAKAVHWYRKAVTLGMRMRNLILDPCMRMAKTLIKMKRKRSIGIANQQSKYIQMCNVI